MHGKNDSGLAAVSKFAVIFELPQTKIILFAIFELGYTVNVDVELLYCALQYIYGRTVVLLYKPMYDEKQKVDYRGIRDIYSF